MKKRFGLVILLCTLVTLLLIIILEQNRSASFDVDNDENIYISLRCGEGVQQLYPYYDETSGIYYFFLPAYVKENKIYNNLWSPIIIEGNELPIFQSFSWEEDKIYSIECETGNFNAIFMNSANLSALFINTESGNLDAIHENKENEEEGDITVITSEGQIECCGKLSRFSGRGNTTFTAGKKSYAFTLENPQELCGIERGKKWNLLSLYFENDKIHSKITYDLAQYLEMEYAVGSNWVDLYCNGYYMGLYLLTEAITVGEGRVEVSDLEKENEKMNVDTELSEKEVVHHGEYAYYDIKSPHNISGGYLVEKTVPDRIESEEPFFCTDINNYYFTIKKPKCISEEEVVYICDYIQNIENLINTDGKYWDYIDRESIAKQYLIDKIVMDNDAMWGSTFFYKDKDSDLLKVGPLWDYDRAFGTILTDYTQNIEGSPNAMIGWYSHFINDKEFMAEMVNYYEEAIVYLQWVLEEGIDKYAEYIKESREMDSVIMSCFPTNETSCYGEYENYVRYLKFFIAKRMNYLNHIWEIEIKDINIPNGNGNYHTVRFWIKEECVTELQILDGEQISNFPVVSEIDNYSWKRGNSDRGKVYDTNIPIYENVDLYLFENSQDD